MTKTHWRKILTTDYLGGTDLDDGKGGHKEIALTIEKAVREKVKDQSGKEETCLVLHFKEKAKPMILNVTNSRTIAKLYKSDYIEDWAGKQIQIGTERIYAFGTEHDALRIRPFPPKQKQQTPPPVPAGTDCSRCGQIITGKGKATAKDVVERSIEEFGEPVCLNCWEQSNKEVEGDEE